MDRFFFRSFEDEANRIFDHSLDLIKENLRKASKKSTTPIKPGENKRGNKSFGGFTKERYWSTYPTGR